MNQAVHSARTRPAKAQPRTNDPVRTMADILEVATHEFSEKCFAGARIDLTDGLHGRGLGVRLQWRPVP